MVQSFRLLTVIFPLSCCLRHSISISDMASLNHHNFEVEWGCWRNDCITVILEMEQCLCKEKYALFNWWNNFPDWTVITSRSHYHLADFRSNYALNTGQRCRQEWGSKYETGHGGCNSSGTNGVALYASVHRPTEATSRYPCFFLKFPFKFRIDHCVLMSDQISSYVTWTRFCWRLCFGFFGSIFFHVSLFVSQPIVALFILQCCHDLWWTPFRHAEGLLIAHICIFVPGRLRPPLRSCGYYHEGMGLVSLLVLDTLLQRLKNVCSNEFWHSLLLHVQTGSTEHYSLIMHSFVMLMPLLVLKRWWHLCTLVTG